MTLINRTRDSAGSPDRPAPKLIGSDNRRTLDLNALSDIGVDLVGRLAGIRDGKALFSGSLRNVCALADLKINRLKLAI